MVSAITLNLFLTLVILTSIVLVLILIYFLIRCAKRHETLQDPENFLEVGQDFGRKPNFHRIARQQIQQEHYSDQEQRLSSLPPSIELLPQIKTSEDRAEQWLERGNLNDRERVDGSSGDLGVQKVPKTYKVLNGKGDGEIRWDWRTGCVNGADELPKTKRSKAGELGLHKQALV